MNDGRGVETGSLSKSLFRVDVGLSLGALRLRIAFSSRTPTLAVVGASGAGKSTLLRIIAGVEPRATGLVSFAGETWSDSEREIWVPPWSRPVGWVPQDGLLFPNRTVLSNLRFGARDVRKDEVSEIARLLRIDHLLGRMPNRLSGGERQRVALGRALLARPRLLLLDEPFSALDRPLRAEIRDAVVRWSDRNATAAVLVSHDEEDARHLASEIYTLADGRLSREGKERATTRRARG